jgi:hypothetical protein
VSAEYLAEKIAEMIQDDTWAQEISDVEEDVRSGGAFFDLTTKGRHYEVVVTEWRGDR